MCRTLTICLLVWLCGMAAHARPIISDLAVHSVDISHDFQGMDILLYGARNDTGRVIVVLRGPKKDYMVRKKARLLGIWMNRYAIEYKGVDSFYTLATSLGKHGEEQYDYPIAFMEDHLDRLKNSTQLDTLGVGLQNLHKQPIPLGAVFTQQDLDNFWSAFLAKQLETGRYNAQLLDVDFWGETLFRTVLQFPKNIEKGTYTAEIYLVNGGMISAVEVIPINVEKVGFEAWLYNLAHHQSLLYGLLCVLMASMCGWLASAMFRKI